MTIKCINDVEFAYDGCKHKEKYDIRIYNGISYCITCLYEVYKNERLKIDKITKQLGSDLKKSLERYLSHGHKTFEEQANCSKCTPCPME